MPVKAPRDENDGVFHVMSFRSRAMMAMPAWNELQVPEGPFEAYCFSGAADRTQGDLGPSREAEKRLCMQGGMLLRHGAMDLRHLRYFIAVAEEGSLTLARGKASAHGATVVEPPDARPRGRGRAAR